MHHDVFGFAGLNHALNAGQQLVDELLFGVGHLAVALDKARFGAVDHLHFAQAVRFQRGAGGDEVTDGIGQARTRRHFNGAIQQTGFKLHAFLIEVTLQQVRVRGGDTFAVQRGRAVPGFIDRRSQRQAAAAKVQTTQGKVARIFALRAAG